MGRGTKGAAFVMAGVLMAMAGCGSSGLQSVPEDRLSATARYNPSQLLDFIQERVSCNWQSWNPGPGGSGVLGESFCSNSTYGPLRITLFTDRVTSQFVDEYSQGRCGTPDAGLYVAGANWVITPATQRAAKNARKMGDALGVAASDFCAPDRGAPTP